MTASTSFHAMGSKITITLDLQTPRADEILRRARAWFREWELAFSRFDPESELSRFNRQSGQTVALSPALWSVIRAALRGARQTGGLVSPTVLQALEAAGYDRSFEQIGRQDEKPRPPAPVPDPHSWQRIEMDAAHKTIRLPASLRLDLGGVAKGWAADRAARRLGRVAPALVNAGGDIAASGPRDGERPWMVGVGRPENADRHLALLPLLRGGLATSGRNYRRWEQDGRPRHHLIDPRTGQPAETDVLAATAVAPSALEAEIAAKAVFILGSKAGMAWLARRPRLAAILVLEDGQVIASSNIRAYLT